MCNVDTKVRKPRGFAAMSPERRREICAKGGKAAHAQGKAHKFTSEEARAAGSIGGARVASRGRAYMSEIGRKGGLKSRRGVATASRPASQS